MAQPITRYTVMVAIDRPLKLLKRVRAGKFTIRRKQPVDTVAQLRPGSP